MMKRMWDPFIALVTTGCKAQCLGANDVLNIASCIYIQI
jgi:hypothetical protein